VQWLASGGLSGERRPGKALGRSALVIVLVALILPSCVTAGALQEKAFNSARPNLYIRTGPAFLIGDTPNTVEPMFGIGYERPLHRTVKDPDRQTMIGFSLDYIPVRSTRDGRETISTMPELLYLKRTGLIKRYHVWGAIGAGARWSSADLPEMKLHVDQNPAWMLQAGIDFTRNYFAGVRFIGGWRPGIDGLFTTEVGYRF
jgi:hypothetical protein